MHGSTKAYLQHGCLQSVKMAGLQTRLASNGSSILNSIQDKRQLEVKGSSSWTTMEAIVQQTLGYSVTNTTLSSSGCLLILHIYSSHWMLAALVL